jgi:NADH-quinone oxidoreductase subunit M
MFTGLYRFNGWYAAVAGISIILAAVYTLTMIQKVFYGNTTAVTESVTDISLNEKIVLSIIVLIIFALGIYPQPIIDLTKDAVDLLVKVK